MKIKMLLPAVLLMVGIGLFSSSTAEKLDLSQLGNIEDAAIAAEEAWDYPIPREMLENNEYIVLANRDNLLGEDYVPEDLVKLTCRKISSDPIQMRKAAAEALSDMFDAAKADGITLYAHSGYRSYRTQKTMYYNRLKSNKGKDDGVVAYPGSSDHQTGLGIDVINKSGIGKRFTSAFAKTKEGIWLEEHSAEYGFVIRYEKDKEEITKIIYEPWHLRYVGTQIAQYMKLHNLCLEEFTEEWKSMVN